VFIFLVPYVSCHSAGFEVNPCYSAYEDESQFLASWPDMCSECYEPPSSAGITGEISLFLMRRVHPFSDIVHDFSQITRG
jgi:hypothetical protein